MNQFNAKRPPRQTKGPWNGLGFPNKKSWETAVHALKSRTPHGSWIAEGPDHDLIMGTLLCHPEAIQKVGCGVRRFSTRWNRTEMGSGTCFWFERWDATREDFGPDHCFAGKPVPLRLRLQSALRHAINPTKRVWFDAQFDGLGFAVCAISGKVLERKDANADHKHPMNFVVLADKWCALAGVTPENAIYRPDGLWALADDLLNESWVAYHNANVTYQILDARINSQLGARAPEDAA